MYSNEMGMKERLASWSTVAGIHFGVFLALTATFAADPEIRKKIIRSFVAYNVPTMSDGQSDKMDKLRDVPPPMKEKSSLEQKREEEVNLSKPSGIEANIWTPPPPPKSTADTAPVIDKSPVSDSFKVVLPEIKKPEAGNLPILIEAPEIKITDPNLLRTARRLEGYGVVSVRIEVTVFGSPDNCQIERSSGSEMLDLKACELVKQFRYKPGTDDKGNPVSKKIVETVEWLSSTGKGSAAFRQGGNAGQASFSGKNPERVINGDGAPAGLRLIQPPRHAARLRGE